MTTMDAWDVFFAATLSFLTLCVATWNGYNKKEIIYKWMEVDFIAILLFRVLVMVDHVISSGIRMNLYGEHVHRRARLLALYALYMIFYPLLWAWNIIGFVWYFMSSEYDWLPGYHGAGLESCFWIFLVLSFSELFRFACSSVKRHLAAEKQPLHRSRSHLRR